jgi:AcrR family transcriptional regulator
VETRQAIVDAAYRTFAEKGYAQATIDDIAAVCGVSKGAIYHHFSNKEQLFRTLFGDHSDELDAIGAAAARASSLHELIRGVVDVWFHHYRDDPLFTPLSIEFRAQATRASWAREIVAQFYSHLRDLIAGMLRVAQEAGLVRPDLDVYAAAILLFGALDGACLQAAIDPEHVDLDAISRPLVDLVERYTTGRGKGDIRKFQRSLQSLLAQSALRQEAP